MMKIKALATLRLGLMGLAVTLISPVDGGAQTLPKAPAKPSTKGVPKVKDVAYKVPAKTGYDYLPVQARNFSLNASLWSNPLNLNPILATDNTSNQAIAPLSCSLMSYDADTMEFLPEVAAAMKYTSDYKEFTLQLDPDAKWEDGSPLTADDFIFMQEKMRDPKVDAAVLRTVREGIEITKLSDISLKIAVANPRADTILQISSLAPIQKKQFEKEKDFNRSRGVMEPVGCGPYKLTAFKRDQRMEYERNDQWWAFKHSYNKNRYVAKTMTYRIITDANLRYEKLIKNEIDTLSLSADQYSERVKGSDKAVFGSSPKDGKKVWANQFENKAPRPWTYIAWNHRKPMFNTVRVRTALSHLVDYSHIQNRVLGGLYIPATSPWGSLTPNSDPELRTKLLIGTDFKKAVELLKAEGWKDTDGDNILDKMIDGKKVPFRFTIKTNSGNIPRAKIAEVVRENFKKAGIQVDLRVMEWSAFLKDVDNRDFDSIILGWTGVPFPNPKQIWHSTSDTPSGSNFVGYKNLEVDKMIDVVNAELNMKKREKLLQTLNRMIYLDQPYTFVAETRGFLGGFSSKIASEKVLLKYSSEEDSSIFQYATP